MSSSASQNVNHHQQASSLKVSKTAAMHGSSSLTTAARAESARVLSFEDVPFSRSARSHGESTVAELSPLPAAPRQVSEDSRRGRKAYEKEPKTSEVLERNLGRIHTAMESDSMAAFGHNKEEILKGISEIRKRQVDIFRHQMHLEFSLSMDENEDESLDAEQKIFSSEGFSEEFQEKFKKKERVLDGVHHMLEDLTKQLREVNAASVVAHMPADPSYESSVRQRATGEGNGAVDLGDLPDTEWNVDFP